MTKLSVIVRESVPEVENVGRPILVKLAMQDIQKIVRSGRG